MRAGSAEAGRQMRIEVDETNSGERLDALLAVPLGSRARAQRLIAAGQVTVDGEVAPKSSKPTAGSVVEIDESDLREIRPDGGPAAEFRIAYEDESLLVVDKPAGVVVHPARGHSTGTLVQALAGRAAGGEDPERPGIVHRLDRDTSGLLVVARDEATHRALRAAMSKRSSMVVRLRGPVRLTRRSAATVATGRRSRSTPTGRAPPSLTSK